MYPRLTGVSKAWGEEKNITYVMDQVNAWNMLEWEYSKYFRSNKLLLMMLMVSLCSFNVAVQKFEITHVVCITLPLGNDSLCYA